MSFDDDFYDDSFDDEYDQDRFRNQGGSKKAKKKEGMSTGMKVLIILLCVGGGFGVICCGGMFYIGSKAADMVVQAPEKVIALTKEIVEIEIPEESFSAKMGMNFDMFGVSMKMVAYESSPSGGALMLMEMDVPNSGSPEQQATEMRNAMRQQQGVNQKQLNVGETETKTFTIRGEEIEFQFADAEDPNSKAAFKQITGVFSGKGGTALLLIQVPKESYDEERTVKIIESIK